MDTSPVPTVPVVPVEVKVVEVHDNPTVSAILAAAVESSDDVMEAPWLTNS
jgi:hypothetical protein